MGEDWIYLASETHCLWGHIDCGNGCTRVLAYSFMTAGPCEGAAAHLLSDSHFSGAWPVVSSWSSIMARMSCGLDSCPYLSFLISGCAHYYAGCLSKLW